MRWKETPNEPRFRPGDVARLVAAGAEQFDSVDIFVGNAASGVLRRHPDIRLLRRESDIMPMLAAQRQIIDALWRLLKPGGSLLYCTCSVFRDENEIQIGSFLERHADCREISLAGVAWGILLFGEVHSPWIWGALVVMIVGLALIKPHAPSPR